MSFAKADAAPERARLHRAIRRSVPRIGATAADGRCAAWDVSLGRNRFERHRRGHERDGAASRSRPSRSPLPSAKRTNWNTRGCAASAFGTDHHEIIVSPQQFFDALPELVYQEDEPIAHPSSVPLYFVSRLASEHVKVVLTGEGSDELLAGYDKYRKTIYNLALGRAYHAADSGCVAARCQASD